MICRFAPLEIVQDLTVKSEKLLRKYFSFALFVFMAENIKAQFLSVFSIVKEKLCL